MMTPPARAGSRGQAALELLAALPLVIAAALLVWQGAAVVWAGVIAQERVRAQGLELSGGSGVREVRAEVPVPALLPGLDGLRVRARAAVRLP